MITVTSKTSKNLNFKNDKNSIIMNNSDFCYTRITIDQPVIEDDKIVVDKKGKTKIDKTLR